MTDTPGAKLVGLVGYPESGKDALAGYLVENFGWKRVAFGDAVKAMLLRIDPSYGGDLEALESTKRAAGSVTRVKLQGLGEEIRKIRPDYWIDRMKDKLPGMTENIIIPDVRYYNEASFVRAHDQARPGTIVGVKREGYGAVNDHESERFTGQLLGHCDVVLENNSTIKELAARLITCV